MSQPCGASACDGGRWQTAWREHPRFNHRREFLNRGARKIRYLVHPAHFARRLEGRTSYRDAAQLRGYSPLFSQGSEFDESSPESPAFMATGDRAAGPHDADDLQGDAAADVLSASRHSQHHQALGLSGLLDADQLGVDPCVHRSAVRIQDAGLLRAEGGGRAEVAPDRAPAAQVLRGRLHRSARCVRPGGDG